MTFTEKYLIHGSNRRVALDYHRTNARPEINP